MKRAGGRQAGSGQRGPHCDGPVKTVNVLQSSHLRFIFGAMTRIPDLQVGNRLHETAAIVALLRSRALTPYRLSAVIDEIGSAVRIVQMAEEDRLFSIPQPTHELIGQVTNADMSQALADVRVWTGGSFQLHTVLDADYPAALRSIFNRPPLLTIQGEWDERLLSRSIAIVGTRNASVAGRRRADRMARALVKHDFAIFSGLAAGIDTAAHAAAIDDGGLTVAVMGTGMYRRFPAQNAALADRIVETGGALVSQFFPNQPPTSWTFPNRNVVMSGLTMATVVIEASETSGAKMQARVALQHGRTVFLVKSLVESHEWARKYVEKGIYGTHAIQISSPDEIVDRLSGRELELRTA